ncbi:MAG: HAD-IB family phosphatase [Patescibacteria group bacterium]|nr:HAD-IB family phosphatase [Patescibacteria group bacterium]
MKERNDKNYLVVDFDSTFVKLESLDNLADFALEGNPQKKQILQQVETTTKLGMEGKITFPQSLSRRLKLFSANKQHINKLIEKLSDNISESIKKNQNFFRENSDKIYIISGGFIDYIAPIAQNFGVAWDHILANEFCFNKRDRITGINKENCLAQQEGKVKAVNALDLDGTIWVVGDGFTDYEIKKAGSADKFVAFVENVKRDNIIEKADHTIENFDDLKRLIEEHKNKMDI